MAEKGNEELNPIDPIIPDDGNGGGNIVETPDTGEIEDDETITKPNVAPPFPDDVTPDGYLSIGDTNSFAAMPEGYVFAYECKTISQGTPIKVSITVNKDEVYGRVVTIEDDERIILVEDRLFSGQNGVSVDVEVGKTYYIQMWRSSLMGAKVSMSGVYKVEPVPVPINNPRKLFKGGELFIIDNGALKKVKEWYHKGKKVLQYYHNGKIAYSGEDPYAYGGYIKDGLVLQLDCRRGVVEPTRENTDDAAFKQWGGDWRVPTVSDIDDLVNDCTWTLSSVDGVRGYIVSDGVNNIFLPFAGIYEHDELTGAGEYCSYHSATLAAFGDTYCLSIYNEGYDRERNMSVMETGYVIRPILNGVNSNGHDYVMINGKKWATCNIGAVKSSDSGDYFAWCETEPKTSFTEENYVGNRQDYEQFDSFDCHKYLWNTISKIKLSNNESYKEFDVSFKRRGYNEGEFVYDWSHDDKQQVVFDGCNFGLENDYEYRNEVKYIEICFVLNSLNDGYIYAFDNMDTNGVLIKEGYLHVGSRKIKEQPQVGKLYSLSFLTSVRSGDRVNLEPVELNGQKYIDVEYDDTAYESALYDDSNIVIGYIDGKIYSIRMYNYRMDWDDYDKERRHNRQKDIENFGGQPPVVDRVFADEFSEEFE